MPKLKRTAEEKKARGDGSEFIESLDRGLRVLQSFGVDRRPMTLSDVAKASSLPRATARRILMTLEKSGFVSGDERLFSLTPRILLLASAYLASNQINTVMQPLMDEVSTKAKEVCSLALLDGDRFEGKFRDGVHVCDPSDLMRRLWISLGMGYEHGNQHPTFVKCQHRPSFLVYRIGDVQ